MKRFGYKPAFAGGVEACSSMGGQIMPPVMGRSRSSCRDTQCAVHRDLQGGGDPATLYFVSCFWMVHLEAGG